MVLQECSAHGPDSEHLSSLPDKRVQLSVARGDPRIEYIHSTFVLQVHPLSAVDVEDVAPDGVLRGTESYRVALLANR